MEGPEWTETSPEPPEGAEPELTITPPEAPVDATPEITLTLPVLVPVPLPNNKLPLVPALDEPEEMFTMPVDALE